MKINLFTTYFKSESEDRQKELDYCLMQNLRNLYINQINIFLDQNTRSSDFYHFFEEPDSYIYANKLNFIKIDRIPTYKDWIEHSIKNNAISIFANADIYFDESINKTYKYLEQSNSLICLSRYEDFNEYIVPHENPHWSQDSWVINFSQENNFSFIKELDIPTGKYRCDNKIAYIFSVNGWNLYNPFPEIKSYHKHSSNLRSYDQTDTTIIGSLAFVNPVNTPEEPSIVEYHIMPIHTKNIKQNAVVGQWLESQIKNKIKPIITVPLCGEEDHYYYRKKNGFYQIVMAWQERGYVDLEFSTEADHYWWNGKNNILLFDRDLVIELHDTKKDPPRWSGELKYNFGFFGNQYNLENNINFKMTYWSFLPTDLEQYRLTIGKKTYEERTFDSIFIGSMENETQEYFRNMYTGWESEIDFYSFVDRLNNKGEKFKYSFDQYLNKVSNAKFGVCFRGNGPKCYREIEYLSLGTPLIITNGVEVDYPDSLVEGTHYFLANNKIDIQSIIKNTTQEKWEKMSMACWEWFEKNATIDSMFKYLKSEITNLKVGPSHKKININCKNESKNSIAYKSTKIFNPDIEIVFNEKNTLSIEPDDVVINQITYLGSENKYTWKIKKENIKPYIEKIKHSQLQKNKDLLIALGLRFENYKVTRFEQGIEIPNIDIRDNKISLLKNESVILKSDFDFSRRCEMKYKNITKSINGPTEFRIPKIQATLFYTKNDKSFEYEMSKYFNDYYAIYETLIPEEFVYNICKLWEFEGCKLDKIISSRDGVIFEYHTLKYRSNDPMDFIIL